MANPIWKDYYVNLGTSDFEYRILCDEVEVYYGKAIRRPGQTYNNIRINDICADYIEHHVPDFSERFTIGGGATFLVQKKVASTTWQDVESVTFYADWSYEHDFNPQLNGLSCPINGRVTLLTPVPYSAIEFDEVEVYINKGGGSEDYWYFNGDYKTGTSLVDIHELAVGNTIYMRETNVTNNRRYVIVDSCAEYALYYVNAYGGWDMLLIEGNHSESDGISRFTREVEYDNRVVSNRGRQNYVNEISKDLTLHTSWMSDDESARMHHLLNSTNVYLFDIDKQSLTPVILKNATTDHKTYKSNGCKLVNYAIELSLANDRVRR